MLTASEEVMPINDADVNDRLLQPNVGDSMVVENDNLNDEDVNIDYYRTVNLIFSQSLEAGNNNIVFIDNLVGYISGDGFADGILETISQQVSVESNFCYKQVKNLCHFINATVRIEVNAQITKLHDNSYANNIRLNLNERIEPGLELCNITLQKYANIPRINSILDGLINYTKNPVDKKLFKGALNQLQHIKLNNSTGYSKEVLDCLIWSLRDSCGYATTAGMLIACALCSCCECNNPGIRNAARDVFYTHRIHPNLVLADNCSACLDTVCCGPTLFSARVGRSFTSPSTLGANLGAGIGRVGCFLCLTGTVFSLSAITAGNQAPAASAMLR